jgi:DNA replication protein DnaC
MTAFLKIDNCQACRRALPWEWVPAVVLSGKKLVGTGVWRSQLLDRVCSDCHGKLEMQRDTARRDLQRRKTLIELLGGEKPYREFTFDRFRILPGNQLAYEHSRNLNPAADNLYLWGPCGVGKTHLAWATARHCFEETLSITILRAGQLSRLVRMRDATQEQAVIDGWIVAELLVLDDLGTGTDTTFSRQILQEILDGRDFADRAGLVITSKYSLSDLAQKLGDDAIPSRLAGMCRIVEIKDVDYRLGPPDL